jgi:glutaredoxin-related protein
MYKTKFGPEYGELIIATDSKNYWRKQLFPYYKANRKKSRAADGLDWKSIFECLNRIKEELKLVFPYRVIDVETAEADDAIGTLCIEFGNTNQKILILSPDKDFQQLQRYINIRQYNPVLKKFITCNDPDKFLAEHILKGDAGDGIPNILSDDNCFVLGSRQKPMTQKKMDDLIALGLDGKFDHTNFRNYMRNKQLIDLTQVPEGIKLQILASYHQQMNKKSNNLLQYFIDHKLRNLTESIADFV